LAPHLDLVPLSLPVFTGTDPDKAAIQTRRTLQVLHDDPISNLTNTAERAGIVILSLPPQVKGPDVFSFWLGDDPPRPIIAISKDRPVQRENDAEDRAQYKYKWKRPDEFMPGWTRCFGILVPPLGRFHDTRIPSPGRLSGS